MKACLDTSAYSRFMCGHKPLIELLEMADEILVPVTVLGELHAGFEQGTRRSGNLQKLDEFLSLPDVSTGVITADIAERYGILVAHLRRAGTPLPTNDIWIAAVALDSGAKLVAYDGHFSVVPGLIVLAP